jgi:hypothetical protein
MSDGDAVSLHATGAIARIAATSKIQFKTRFIEKLSGFL